MIQKLLHDCLTGCDGHTYDSGRVAGFVGTVVFLGLSIWNHDKFDPLAFGTGFGALATGVGALIALKKGTEPTQ